MSLNLTPVADFFKALTWTKIAQLFVLFLLLAFAWLAWQFRGDMYTSLKMESLSDVDKNLVIEVSDNSKRRIENLLQRRPDLIGAIQIVNVNFKKNTRSSAYFSATEPIIRQSETEYRNSQVSATPLFNDNEVNNQRLVDLVNGNYICTPFKETLGAKIYPKASDTITTICSLGIPPYYGKFTGYMNIYLRHKPDKDDYDMVRMMAREISNEIYNNDVLNAKADLVNSTVNPKDRN